MEDFTLPTSDQPVPDKLLELSTEMLNEVIAAIKLERALIIVKLDGKWHVAVSHEIPTNDFWNLAPISLGILQSAVDDREVILLVDAGQSDQFGGRTSVVLSGLRSVACAPYLGDSGEALAVVYADNRVQTGAFSQDDAQRLQELVNQLGERLTSAF